MPDQDWGTTLQTKLALISIILKIFFLYFCLSKHFERTLLPAQRSCKQGSVISTHVKLANWHIHPGFVIYKILIPVFCFWDFLICHFCSIAVVAGLL